MKQEAAIAQDLAIRLSELGIGEFIEHRGRVSRITGAPLALEPIRIGRGRPSDVERALTRASALRYAVLVADDYSPGALRLLTEAAANYADRRRIHIVLASEGLYIHLEEVELGVAETEGLTLPSLAGATGAVVQAILEHPEAEHKVTLVAEVAGVSPATAQKVLFGLEADGFVTVRGRGPNKVRALADPSALLDRYAADAVADRRLAVRCRVLGGDTIEIVRRVAARLSDASVLYCVTGAAAALIEAPALTAVSRPELWVQGPRTPEYLLRAVDGVVSEEGANLVLWRATTRGPMALSRHLDEIPGIRLASRFRVYADLLASSQRGREQAEVYRERMIGF